jgi:tetratricopeptide (TPR) repeat protein
MPDGYEEDQFLDAKTHRCIASRKVAKIHAFGADVATETRFSDFRKVEGVLFPFLAQKVDIATGKVLNTFKTTSIEVNPKLDVSVFSPPDFKRTPLQGLLERLFAERTDKEAVLWSYRDFRAAHSDVDTDFAMEVIGYQILKMGEAETAIALLDANAEAYPKSSGAAFGVGRAYNTAGDAARAKEAFQRAVTLDPGNKRAAAALKALEEAPKP